MGRTYCHKPMNEADNHANHFPLFVAECVNNTVANHVMQIERSHWPTTNCDVALTASLPGL